MDPCDDANGAAMLCPAPATSNKDLPIVYENILIDLAIELDCEILQPADLNEKTRHCLPS
jgi:hypothetical protein